MTYIYISFDMVIDSERISWQLKTKSPAETVLMSLCNCYHSAKFISQGELFVETVPNMSCCCGTIFLYAMNRYYSHWLKRAQYHIAGQDEVRWENHTKRMLG